MFWPPKWIGEKSEVNKYDFWVPFYSAIYIAYHFRSPKNIVIEIIRLPVS